MGHESAVGSPFRAAGEPPVWQQPKKPVADSISGQAGHPAFIDEGTETILVVEDDESVRTLVHRMLQRFGYRVLEARDGHEALAIVDSEGGMIRLVLSDIILPDLGGPEIMRRVLVRSAHIKALFMSGHTNQVLLRDSVLESQTNFIQKPFTGRALASKVREVLDSRT